MTAIASTPKGHNVKPPPGPAEPPARTTPSELTDEQQGWLSEASRSEINGWLHVTIKGSPAARGFQYGFLVADEYAESVRVYREMTYQDIGMGYDFFVERAAELHADKIPDELREEMEGVAAGLTAAGVPATFKDVLGINDWMELTGYWWPKNSGRYTALAPTGGEGNHCSAFIATGSATVDASIVVGHTSFADFWQGQFENVILDMTPDDGNRIVMQTAPGWIASMSDFWLTGAGLVITETTIGGYDGFKGYDETRVPEFVRARKASQYARDIDHWVETLNTDNNGGYANSWLIGDVKTGEIARYEEGLLYQSLSRTTDGYFWGDNAVTDPRIRNLECFGTGFSDVRTPNGAREVRWRQLLGQYNGRIDVEVGKRMMGDTFDTYLGYIHPSARTICAHSDVDPCHFSGLTPFTPFGSVDGKVATSADIKALNLWARCGRADGTEFDAEQFLRQHPQWDWQRGYLKGRPQQPWTYVASGSSGEA
ncbi:C45 family autoproteolytic acyltransferase/hydolase [Mycobacterium sp.]|uniref:C45 family autoproteolytic acyltransferase/hydolase n=1 Tax=Mycobacterium sp. TaxID=1785 RepID=UPI002BDB77B3|nr:C45 family autoproteolytic acyltransferase/hydolase [Mycobacterium sp.]HTQ21447.1 C45 family autoproteolytic acyltransferase/hydrolase [Mycobacterium sp.]